MNKGILVAGSIIVDNIYEVNKYPRSGELTKIINVNKSIGGLVSNVAVDLKKLDKSLPVFASGKIGDDENGRFVLNLLKKENVDVTNIRVSSSLTSFSEVISEVGGQRTFLAYPGACDEFSFSDIDFKSLDVDMLHLGYFLLLDKIDKGDGLKILKEAKKHNIITSIDLVSENSDRYELVIPCLKYVDNLLVNEIEASQLTNISYNEENVRKILDKLKSYGVINRIVIHSKEISYMLKDGKVYKQASQQIDPKLIKGSTGAGDAFVSGILYGIYKGYEEDNLLSFASKAAAISLFSNDATSAIRSANEVKNYFNK